MSQNYAKPNKSVYVDSPLDAFGRVKVAMPDPLFDNMSEYGNNLFFWETLVSGSGTVATVANNCAVRLSTGGTTSGHYAYRATRQYMRYQPGRSLNIETTFVMSAAQTAARARIGYFDASNGIFFERSASTLNIVRRTNVTGTPTDTTVAQTSWNIDTFSATAPNPSGITLDVTKAQILFIQLQFLGVGRVQVGFVIDGVPYVAHEFLNTNSLATVYMSTGCLPVRGEVQNTGTAGGTVTMDMFCTSVSSGGSGAQKVPRTTQNITGASTTTTLTPIISIRAATLYGGTGGGGSIVNRGHIQLEDFSLYVTSQPHAWAIILNPTLTGASWVAVGADSIADYDVSSTSYTGGTVLERGMIAASASVRASVDNGLRGILPLVYTGLNSTQDIVTLAARTFSSTGSAYATINWFEEY